MKRFFNAIFSLNRNLAGLQAEIKALKDELEHHSLMSEKIMDLSSQALAETKQHSKKLTDYLIFDQRERIETRKKKEEEELSRAGTKYDGLF